MRMYLLTKRAIDLVVVLLLLPPTMLLFIPVALMLYFSGDGEVFYRQRRIGYLKRPFDILKFVTMIRDSDHLGSGSVTLRDDFRVTPLGRYLRLTKLNELPQIINVLRGDMSLVGPRPQMAVDFETYPPYVQDVIYDVRPGITGIGSIIFRDEEEMISGSGEPPQEFFREHIMPYKGELELWYQNHASTLTDLKLIFLTAWVIVNPHSTMPFRLFANLPAPPPALLRWITPAKAPAPVRRERRPTAARRREEVV